MNGNEHRLKKQTKKICKQVMALARMLLAHSAVTLAKENNDIKHVTNL